MRTLPIISAALLTSFAAAAQSAAAAAPAASQPEGIACFENLQAPEFPRTALQQHVDGSVWSWTHVDVQGGIGKIDTQVVSAWSDGSKLLTAPVEKAIRAAKIKPECNGKTVSVVFRYQLFGQPVAQPKTTSRTDPPNLMWIESQPLTETKKSVSGA